jgi:hypothetical protein
MSASAISGLLNTTVQVQRRQTVDDGIGGQQVTWQTVAEQLPARISSPPTSTTSGTLAAAQTMEKVPFYVYFDTDADVRRGDVLVASDGRRLWVEAVTWPSIQAYLRAGVREWQTEPSQEQAG